MKRAIVISLATLAAFAASAAVPVKWVVDTSRPKVAVFDSFHGETLALEVTFQTDGKPLEMAGNAKLCWQTNGMDTVWWTADATISNNVVAATFLPTMDPGASQLIAFLGVPGDVWRAEFRLRFRSSPGASPNEMELPVKTIDFSQIEVSNAPWLLKDDAYSKTEVDSKISTAVATETDRATNAEGEIKTLADTNATAISTETTRAKAAESTNATAIATETTRAKAAEATNATAIANETTRAKAAESEIKTLAQNHIDNKSNPHAVTASQVGAYTTSEVDTKLKSYVPTTRKVNSKALSSDITLTASDVGAYAKADTYSKTEIDTRDVAVSNAVTAAVTAETTRAKAAESTNATAIANETTRAKAAEATNATAISTETTRAKAAESEIKTLAQNHIDNKSNPHAVTASQVGAYTTTEVDTKLKSYVPTTRKVNSKALSSDITLSASDVGAYAKADTYTKTEVNTRDVAVSNAVTAAVTAETTRAKAAEATNATAISTETTRATKAETEIKTLAQNHIDNKSNPHAVTASQVGAYTTAEVDTKLKSYVPTTRKVNSKALSSDITLSASDVGAYAKADTYTKTEVDSKVAAAAPADYANVSNLAYTAVQSRFVGLNFIDTTNTYFSSKSNPALGFLLDSYVNEVESDPTVSAWAKAATKPTYTAAEVGAVPTTRKVNSKALSSDITLSASDVGAYAKSEVYTKTEAAAQFYPKTDGDLWESWWSGDGFRVSVTNYNVTVTDSTAWERLPTASFDYKTNETTTAYTAVWNENTKWDRWLSNFATYTNENATALDNKADRAWGNYDSTTGLEAPEGYTWISSEHVALSAGLAYQKFVTTGGAVWVLTSNGLTTETSGVASNAFFRVSDDTGNALFEIIKGDKVTVGANVDGITVDNTANPITVTISYPVASSEHPVVEATATLTNIVWQTSSECDGAWTESWSGSSGAWTNTITMTQSPPCYFFRAYYQKGGDTYINNAAPVALQKVVLGGVTYSITVEEVNGKKLMVLTEVN